MASKPQANPSCATGISFIEFLLDKSNSRLHCSTSSAINYLNSSKTLGGVLTRLKCQKKKAEQNRAACMHSCMLRKTILMSPSAHLDHFYNGFEVVFDL